MKRLEGKTAVITGAARGIGACIASRFAEEGASLLLVDRMADELISTAKSLRAFGGKVETLTANIMDANTPEQILTAVTQSFGGADILVNNAGVGISGTIEDFTQEQWDRVIDVNLSAAFRISRLLVPVMAQKKYGRVINISSICGLQAMRQDAAYAVTKAGLLALARSIAVDYGRFGVTANAIAPGTIVTPLNAAILAQSPSWMRRTVQECKPLPGSGQGADIAAAAAFFASDDARFVTGQVLAVDGGWSTTCYVPDQFENEVIADSGGSSRYLPDNLETA